MSNHPALAPGRVAVITGAASGIGLAAARRFASLGMKVGMADANAEALQAAAASVAAQSPDDVRAFTLDVSDLAEVQAFRRACYDAFGEVAVLMNNAGIGGGGGVFGDPERWRRLIDVNLWGVINGVQSFGPEMIKQGTLCAIVNTGSKQGITTPPGDTAYNVSKAGVKVVTEALAHELRNTPDCRVSAHLLIPGFTFTGITSAPTAAKPPAAWTADQVVDFLLPAMAAGDFYVLCPDNDVTREIDERRMLWAAQDIVENRPRPLALASRLRGGFQDVHAGAARGLNGNLPEELRGGPPGRHNSCVFPRMNVPMLQNATSLPEPAMRASPFRDWRAPRVRWQALADYLQVLGGAGGRLALQTVYFLILANTLNLREMGIFATVSGAGMIIGCFTGFGFQGLLFRAAAGRPHSLGGVFAGYYVAFAASLPIGAVAAGALYLLLFAPSIGPLGYFTIVAVEIGLWRFIEMLVQVNNGLGRYAAAAHVLMASAGFRALAAVAFLFAGGGDATRWAGFYLCGNAAAFVVLGCLYHPRVRLRWRRKVFLGRLRDGLFYAVSYCAFIAQNEADKLVILWLAGDRMAGLYVIAMRILDLTAAPLRPLFVIYSRKLVLAGRSQIRLLGEILRVEAFVAVSSIAAFFALLALLSRWPDALGHNLGSAYGLIGSLALVPVARNLIEFHGELFFAFDRMAARGVVAASLVALKSASLALLITVFAGSVQWGPWLNAIYVGIYLMSLVTVRVLLK